MHKHVALLALLAALKRKDKPFLFVDTHAGGGSYRLDADSRRGDPVAATDSFLRNAAEAAEPEIAAYAHSVLALRERSGDRRWYPGSPLLATRELRPQDRGVCFELDAVEADRLADALARETLFHAARVRAERADGFERLRSLLPPQERRALILIDPPYESDGDYAQIGASVIEALRRLSTAVIAVWYPIKDVRDCERWLQGVLPRLATPAASLELWMYARDSRVSLNGSGLLVLNPPYLIVERAQAWQEHLLKMLQGGPLSGSRTEVYDRSDSGEGA